MVSRRDRRGVDIDSEKQQAQPIPQRLAALAKSVPPDDLTGFRRRLLGLVTSLYRSSPVQRTRKRKMSSSTAKGDAPADTTNQVNGKRRHAKRVFADYYTGDESTAARTEPGGQSTHSRRHSSGGRLETPKRSGDSPARSGANSAARSAAQSANRNSEDSSNPYAKGYRGSRGGGNPYAKSYGKEGKPPSIPEAAVGRSSSHTKDKSHSNNKANQKKGSAAPIDLAANTRALAGDKGPDEADPEHRAGESFWRSLVPCFRLISPDDAKALRPRGTDPVNDPLLRRHELGVHYSYRWMMEDLIDFEGLDQHLENSAVTSEQMAECALSALTAPPRVLEQGMKPGRGKQLGDQGASVQAMVAAEPTTEGAQAEGLPELSRSCSIDGPNQAGGAVGSSLVGPSSGTQNEILDELLFLQQQLHTVVTCNDVSRSRLRTCATAAMQRQQLLWRKWRYWYEVDRHYRWRQRMSQVHKLILKNRNSKRDTRKAAERCIVSDLNAVDKHLAEYAHAWRPEEDAAVTQEGLDRDRIVELLNELTQREAVTPELEAQLTHAQQATEKDFKWVRTHLHDTLRLLLTTLQRELVKKDLVSVEMDQLDHRVAQATKAVRDKDKKAHNKSINDDELCVQVGGATVLKPGQARPGGLKPGQARPGQSSLPSVMKPGQARPGGDLPSVVKAGQARPGMANSVISPGSMSESLKFMQSLSVGDKLDCLDCENRWGKGVVHEVLEDGVTIHWEGFKKVFDEKVLFVEHLRCTKPGVHVKRTDSVDRKSSSKAQQKRVRSVEVEDVEEVPAKQPKIEVEEDGGDGTGRPGRRNCKSIFRRT